MSEPIHTTVSVAQRTITQLLTDGRTVRYALAASSDGDVYWRQDTFAAADDLIEPLRWLSYEAPLAVGAVIAAVPKCEDTIRAWTRAEVDDAFAGADLDVLGRERRARAIVRLREQLRAASEDEQAIA